MKILIQLCALSIGICYATTNCHELQQSQMASLNDRMTQMLSSFYTSPYTTGQPPTPLSSSNATPGETYYPYPYPQPVIYVSPPSYLPPKPLQAPPIPHSYYPVPSPTPTWPPYYEQQLPFPSPLPPPPPPPPYTPPPPPPAPITYPTSPISYAPIPYPTIPPPPTPYSPSYPSYPTWEYPEYPKTSFPPPQAYYPAYPPFYAQPEVPPYYF